MTIVVRVSDHLTGTPQLSFQDEDGGRVEIVHPADLVFTTATERHNYIQWLKDSLIQIACRLFVIRDAPAWIEKIAGQERGFSRALAIGENDPDASALHEDDDPIIPSGMTDPPVNKALAQIRAFRQTDHHV